MNDSNLDQNQSSLGDAVHSLYESDQIGESKDRIYLLLKNNDSATSRRTKQWCLNHKRFSEYTSTMTKQIHGFRPKSRLFKQKAYEYILQKMAVSHSSKGWGFYENAYIDFLRKDRVELRQLLDLEDGSGLVSSDELIKMVISKAPIYKVSAKDIEELYENWYFIPNPDFEKWILDLKRDSRSIENKHHIQDIENKFSDFQKNIANLNSIISNEQIDDKLAPLLKRLEELNERFKTDLFSLHDKSKKQELDTTELDKKINHLENREKKKINDLSKLKNLFEEKLLRTQNNLKDQLEALENTTKKELIAQSSTIDNKIKAIDFISPSQIVNSQNFSTYQFSNKTIFRDDLCNSSTEDISEKQFIERYLKLLEDTSLATTEKETTFNHSILKCSDVISCLSLDYIDPWISALGWEQHVLEAAVDPNWTNYTTWQDVAIKFLSTDKIRILILHSFNIGYIEGYLNPFLLLFNRESHHQKKIILVRSHSESKTNFIGEGFALLENHKEKLGDFRKFKKEVFEPISLESFETWSLLENEESEDHAQIICKKLIEFAVRENIKIHKTKYETLYLIICSYLNCKYGLDSKTKKLFFSAMLPNYMSEDKVRKFLHEL